MWACGVCTLENDEAIDVCAACEQPRRAQHQQQQPQPPQPMQQPPTQPAQTQPQAAATPAAVWKCALCTLHNDLTLNVSQVCGYSPYSPYQPPPATAASQAPQQQHTPQRQAAAAGGGPLIDAAAIARASAAWGARFRPLGQGSIPTMGGAAAMAKSIAAAAAGAKRARISLQQMGPGGGRGGAPEATLDWIQRYAADHPGTFSLRPLPADSPLGRWLLPEVTKQLGGAHLRGRRITVHEVASCFQRDYVELTERQYRCGFGVLCVCFARVLLWLTNGERACWVLER